MFSCDREGTDLSSKERDALTTLCRGSKGTLESLVCTDSVSEERDPMDVCECRDNAVDDAKWSGIWYLGFHSGQRPKMDEWE